MYNAAFQLSESFLLQKAQKRNREGEQKYMTAEQRQYFSDMYDKYADMIFRLALSYSKNKSDAEDIVSDVFVKLFENDPQFYDCDHEKAYLIRMTVNTCKDLLKSRWAKRVPISECDVYQYCTCDDDIRLMDDIMRLPPKYRIVIYLYYYEGYSSIEIARMLNIREGTVRSQLARGRGILCRLINEGGFSHV